MEDEIQGAAVDYLQARGELVLENRSGKMNALASRLTGGKKSEKGSPDVIVFLGRRSYLSRQVAPDHGMTLSIEFKRPGQKQSPEQMEWQANLEARGHLYLVAHSVEEVIEYMEGSRRASKV